MGCGCSGKQGRTQRSANIQDFTTCIPLIQKTFPSAISKIFKEESSKSEDEREEGNIIKKIGSKTKCKYMKSKYGVSIQNNILVNVVLTSGAGGREHQGAFASTVDKLDCTLGKCEETEFAAYVFIMAIKKPLNAPLSNYIYIYIYLCKVEVTSMEESEEEEGNPIESHKRGLEEMCIGHINSTIIKNMINQPVPNIFNSKAQNYAQKTVTEVVQELNLSAKWIEVLKGYNAFVTCLIRRVSSGDKGGLDSTASFNPQTDAIISTWKEFEVKGGTLLQAAIFMNVALTQ